MTESFELLIGVQVGDEVLKEVVPLPANGVAERVVFSKTQEKIYTWMGRVITVLTKEIEGVPIGEKARENYAKTRSIAIPDIVKQFTLGDVMTAMIRLHASCWEDTFEEVPYKCVSCGHEATATIHLDRFSVADKFKDEVLSGAATEKYSNYTVVLNTPFEFVSPQNKNGEFMYPDIHGLPVFKLNFRAPVLGDAIKHEKLHNKSPENIDFWMAMAKECLVSAEVAMDENASATEVIEKTDIRSIYGDRLFQDILARKDLANIRKTLRDEMPFVEYFHDIECHDCGSETPLFLEPDNFFSE